MRQRLKVGVGQFGTARLDGAHDAVTFVALGGSSRALKIAHALAEMLIWAFGVSRMRRTLKPSAMAAATLGAQHQLVRCSRPMDDVSNVACFHAPVANESCFVSLGCGCVATQLFACARQRTRDAQEPRDGKKLLRQLC